MKNRLTGISIVILLCSASLLVLASEPQAKTRVVDFKDFKPDTLYESWKTGKVVSSQTNFSVTASGYGSAYKHLGRPPVLTNLAAVNLQATVTLSAAEGADGQLGVLVTLIDADGSEFEYAWYGQHLGHLVLTAPLDSPTKTNAVGKVPGLNPRSLAHLHLQLDPGGFGDSGAYTISWEELALSTRSTAQAASGASSAGGERVAEQLLSESKSGALKAIP